MSIPVLFVLSIVINIGMWFERFVIIVTSLHRDFLPSSWGYFSPTMWDVLCLLGSFGLFFTMFCLFVRFLPMVATAEVKRPAAGRSALAARPDCPPKRRLIDGAQAGEPGRRRRRLADALVDGGRRAPAGASRCRCCRGSRRGRTWILAEFATPADLYHACERVRDAGFTRWDAHSPFPVHGLAGRWGSDAPRFPWIVLVMGLMRPRSVRPAVVGPHQRLPARDQRQTVLHLAAFIPITFESLSSSARSAPSSACSA